MYVVDIAITSNATIMLNESDRDKIVYLTNSKLQQLFRRDNTSYGEEQRRVSSLSIYVKSKIACCAFYLTMTNFLCSK